MLVNNDFLIYRKIKILNSDVMIRNMGTEIFCHVAVHILNRDKEKSHFFTFVIFLSAVIVYVNHYVRKSCFISE
jgi:hypothetical protein